MSTKSKGLFGLGKHRFILWIISYMWGVRLTIIKVSIIAFLLCLWELTKRWQFSKQIRKLSLELSVQVYYVLGQTEEGSKAFFGGCKKGCRIVRLPPRAVGCHKRCKSLSFCEIGNNPTSPLLLTRPPYI